DREVVRVFDLVLRHEPRAQRAERVAALVAAGIGKMLLDALGLVRAALLRIERVVVEAILGAHPVARDVVEDRVAEHRVERARSGWSSDGPLRIKSRIFWCGVPRGGTLVGKGSASRLSTATSSPGPISAATRSRSL